MTYLTRYCHVVPGITLLARRPSVSRMYMLPDATDSAIPVGLPIRQTLQAVYAPVYVTYWTLSALMRLL